MGNGQQRNCILAICCPPNSYDQAKALATAMAEGLSWTPTATSPPTSDDVDRNAFQAASWILENFDLAPKGSLQAFKDEVARLAREGHVKVEPQNGAE